MLQLWFKARSLCPSTAMYCGHGYQGKHYRNLLKNGWVLSKRVTNVDLDTGCLKILIYQKLVPKEKFIQNEAVTIRRTHGDNVLHPVTKLNLVVDGIPLSVEVGVSPTLPVSVLLGTDVLKLSKWLRGSRTEAKEKIAMLALKLEIDIWRKKKENRGLEEVQCSPNLTAIKELKGGKPCRGLRYFTWNTPSPYCYSAMVDYEGFMKEEEDEDIQVWNENENSELVLSDQLSGPQRKQLFQLLKEFKDVLSNLCEIVELDPNKVEAGKSSLYQRPRRLPVRMATRFKECEDAFLSLKVILCGSPALRSPEYEKEFIPQGLPFGKSIYVTNGSQVDRLKDENPRLHHAGARLSALRVQGVSTPLEGEHQCRCSVSVNTVTFIKENGESVMNQVYDITHDILTGSYCDV
ncbi:hypothetical protein EMCRGX_G017108 [Ephydatia muelleri]